MTKAYPSPEPSSDFDTESATKASTTPESSSDFDIERTTKAYTTPESSLLPDTEPATKASPSALFLSPTQPEDVFRISHLVLRQTQLEYMLVNIKKFHNYREVLMVIRYKWPEQFRLLKEKDLTMVFQWVRSNPQVTQRLNLKSTIEDVNTFRIELREAEAWSVRAQAKTLVDVIVNNVLISKIFWNLSNKDIALGLTAFCAKAVEGYTYVWSFPFTETQVETIFGHYLKDHPKYIKKLARMNEKDSAFIQYRDMWADRVKRARADRYMGVDPRSYGNVDSAASLVEEIMLLSRR